MINRDLVKSQETVVGLEVTLSLTADRLVHRVGVQRVGSGDSGVHLRLRAKPTSRITMMEELSNGSFDMRARRGQTCCLVDINGTSLMPNEKSTGHRVETIMLVVTNLV